RSVGASAAHRTRAGDFSARQTNAGSARRPAAGRDREMVADHQGSRHHRGIAFAINRNFSRPMSTQRIETVVIGGGQAGLAMSYCLRRLGREHVILERQRVAERWRSERWDSLAFQSPNWNMHLPGFAFGASDPDAFAARDAVVRFIESYAAFIDAPLHRGLAATALRQARGSTRLTV